MGGSFRNKSEIDQVLEVEEEGPFRRTGSQPDQQLHGEPGGADGLADEERVDGGVATTTVFVPASKGKRLELSTSESVDIQSKPGRPYMQALNLRSHCQRMGQGWVWVWDGHNGVRRE